VETPDPYTVVFRFKAPNASALDGFASPWNCIYHATKLKEDPRYPETKILGTGAFRFVEHVKGQSWEGRRFEGYFEPGLPYLDGYKAFFVKSTGLATGIIGGQFDIEFRGLTPADRCPIPSTADAKIDELFERQKRTLDPAERKKLTREFEQYAISQAYNIMLFWWQRIVVYNRRVKGWRLTPSHYLGNDLTQVWLDH